MYLYAYMYCSYFHIVKPVTADFLFSLLGTRYFSDERFSDFCRVISILILNSTARGSVVVKALCYKPEGCGFDTRRGGFLNLPNPSDRARPWGLLSL
jgi:hypothetical protein